jgi:hypothetical protein
MMNLSERRSWLRRLNAAVRSSLYTVRVCYWAEIFSAGGTRMIPQYSTHV